MRIRRYVDLFLNNDATFASRMPSSFTLKHFCTGAESGVINLNSEGKTTQPPKAIMDLMTSSHFSRNNHDHHGQILACCSLWVLHAPTATA
jgi:hypothetical protein